MTAPQTDLKPLRRALLSVTDKSGLVPFAQALARHSVELVSTGGTARALRDAGLEVKDISDLTGFPEMLDGRVKTLHPRVHGGLLHIRSNPAHVAAVQQHGIEPIDLVVVNLYAFEATASKPGAAFHEIIENIDIGGPSMIRSAAKNFEDVAVVTSPADYPSLTEELDRNSGQISRATRWRLAQAAFETTAGLRLPPSPPPSLASLPSPAMRPSQHRPQHHKTPRAFHPNSTSTTPFPHRCATAKTHTRPRLSTSTAPERASPRPPSFKVRSSPTTT